MADHSSQDQKPQRPARQVGDVLSKLLEPTIARKTGMRQDLMKAWAALAGPEFAETTRPEKIDWPRRANEDDPFKPGVLVVACEPAAALFFQHSHQELVERINQFFGFPAIDRIRIMQKPVLPKKSEKTSQPRPLADKDRRELNENLSHVEDDNLRNALKKLGEGVLRRIR